MPLTVLSNHDVSRLLHSLTKEDIEALQTQLADALHWYSTSADANEYGSDYQPEKIKLNRKDGSTTLFMPSCSCNGQGVKIINISQPDSQGFPSLENLSLDTEHSSRSSISSPTSGSDSPRGSVSTMSTVDSGHNVDTPLTSTSSLPDVSEEGLKESGISGEVLDNRVSTIRGVLTLMDAAGNTTGVINAEEVTAFRTALSSTMMLKKRQSVHDLTVFGWRCCCAATRSTT